jgi:hypothetical protein
LTSFVDEVTSDGKLPPAPEEAVKQPQEILTTLQSTQNMWLMDGEDVKIFVRSAVTSVRFLY